MLVMVFDNGKRNPKIYHVTVVVCTLFWVFYFVPLDYKSVYDIFV